MPSWCNNILTIISDEETIEKIYKETGLASSEFSFNSVLKMPEELKIKSSSSGEFGKIALEGDWKALDNSFVKAKRKKELSDTREDFVEAIKADEYLNRTADLELSRLILDNLKKHGYSTWYDWSLANWGTKWDANPSKTTCVKSSTQLVIYFDTPYNPPAGFFKGLCEKYSEIEATLEWIIVDSYSHGSIGYKLGKDSWSVGYDQDLQDVYDKYLAGSFNGQVSHRRNESLNI